MACIRAEEDFNPAMVVHREDFVTRCSRYRRVLMRVGLMLHCGLVDVLYVTAATHTLMACQHRRSTDREWMLAVVGASVLGPLNAVPKMIPTLPRDLRELRGACRQSTAL